MVRHIVLWNLHEENKEENAAAIKAALEDLNGKIPGLRFLQVGRCYNGYDLCLYSEFTSKQALNSYKENANLTAARPPPPTATIPCTRPRKRSCMPR